MRNTETKGLNGSLKAPTLFLPEQPRRRRRERDYGRLLSSSILPLLLDRSKRGGGEEAGGWDPEPDATGSAEQTLWREPGVSLLVHDCNSETALAHEILDLSLPRPSGRRLLDLSKAGVNTRGAQR